MLLPAGCLLRRADSAGVIGQALALAAAGLGCQTIAERLGRAAATVRGWLRRAIARAEALRSAFTALLCELDPDPLLPGPSESAAADAVAAILAAAVAAARRWGEAGVRVVAVGAGLGGHLGPLLLGPGAAVQMINTSCLW